MKSSPEKNVSVKSDVELDSSFWNKKYVMNDLGWDLGEVSPPIKSYIDQLTNKQIRILIPGCGNSYEASYLLQKGFTDITVIDIAPKLVDDLKNKFSGIKNIQILSGDFFEHTGEYDIIFEQTFFCALDPVYREKYVNTTEKLLSKNGKLVGVLFDRDFGNPFPPFGGNKTQYLSLFTPLFHFKIFDLCFNSFSKRAGTELFMIAHKNVMLNK